MSTPIWPTACSTTQMILRGPWDTVYMGGVQLPGIAKVTGKGLEFQFEKKKSPGMNGSTVTDHGRENAEFTVTLSLGGTANDWADFLKVVPKLQPLRVVNGKQELDAISVSHPAINALGIKSAKVKRIGIPHLGSVIGTVEVELECWEHRPAVAMPGEGTAHKSVVDLDMPIAVSVNIAKMFQTNVAVAYLESINSEP